MEQTPLSLRLLLGLKLRSFRNERGLGLRDLAELTGLSVSYLSEIETGRKYPKLQKLLTLASSLGVGYEDLVSLRTDERLGPIGELLSSSFFREFPLELFRIEPEAVIQLMTEAPIEAGALLRALSEIARTYDLRVEHFLFAALRAYQQLLHNHFPDIEKAAENFLDRHGWRGRRGLAAGELQKVLEEEHGYIIEEETLAGHPVLGDLRSVFVAGPPGLKGRPHLSINDRLLPAQRAFLFGRELGYLNLGLVQRSSTSTQISVDTFAQVINDFKAAYFSGALLLQRELLGADLRRFFALPRWSAEDFTSILASYETTPETFFYRLSQLLPAQLGLEKLFFARLSHRRGGAGIRLTKMLNMSQLPIPAGVEPQEHYCRRWPGSKLLLADDPAEVGKLKAAIQRSYFLDGGGEYLQFSLARPLALAAGTHASVSLGIRLDPELKEKIAFWDDPGIERREVNTTCERCGLRDCLERAAPPTLREEEERQKERAAALRGLFESRAGR